jgi:hypothetical protein
MMADRSQRRADLSIGSGSKQLLLASASQPPIYQPLDSSVDCIRLVMVKPAPADAPIECALSIATFGERRTYKALSYRWGDESVKKQIVLNGSDFSVTQNLWDALHYLRSLPQEKFWIDAICINQGDVEERNRQLRIMPHIYLRANTVLIWLGAKYQHFTDLIDPVPAQTKGSVGVDMCTKQGDIEERSGELAILPRINSRATAVQVWLGAKYKHFTGLVSPNPAQVKGSGRIDNGTLFWQLRRDACSDEYWDRLWIIQEIGKARRIRVCLGALPMDWERFIDLLKVVKFPRHKGPWRLQTQLETKYTGGHKLLNLLDTHKKALCKDPRDKVYGLVGLAADGQGFPMDYQKSLFEVWSDTVTFANKHDMTARKDIVPFARMVGSLFGQTVVPSMSRLLNHVESRPDVWIRKPAKQPGIFRTQAYIIGMIRHMGGTASEMVSRLDTADRWAESLRDNYGRELGPVHRENDLLLQAILESEGLDRLCFGYRSTLYWPHEAPGTKFADLGETSAGNQRTGLRRIPPSQSATESATSLPSEEPFLFQIIPATTGGKPGRWKLGLVTGLARPGNLLCWAPSIGRTIVVEMTQQPNGGGFDCWMRIIGTAVLTGDIVKAQGTPSPSPTSSKDLGNPIALYADDYQLFLLMALRSASGV